MEKIEGLFIRKIWPILCLSVRDVRMLVQSKASFFDRMKKRRGVCSRAWLFGVLVAIGLGALGLPASRGAGVTPNVEFLGVMTLMNWLLVAFYGLCFGLAARLLASRTSMLVSVNTFFYVAVWLVVLKLFEMPTLGARLKAMAQSCAVPAYDQAVTGAISQSPTARLSDIMVFIGYILFFGLVVKMQRGIHGFGWARSFLSALVGMALLSAVASYVQGPVISQLMCSYQSS